MHNSKICSLLNIYIQAPILLSKYLLRLVLLNQTGRIVNVSSIIALTDFYGLSVYAASKEAFERFNKSLAREVGKASITINNEAPDYIQTGMAHSLPGDKLDSIKQRSPLVRLATADDAAAAVLYYLLSEMAATVTDTTVTVDARSTA